MNALAATDAAMKWGGFTLVTIALLALTVGIAATPQGLVMRYWARYCHSIERKLRSMFIFTPGRWVARRAGRGSLCRDSAQIAVELPAWEVWLLLVLFGPPWYIERRRKKRVEAIENSWTAS